jgi:hypothetical protein
VRVRALSLALLVVLAGCGGRSHGASAQASVAPAAVVGSSAPTVSTTAPVTSSGAVAPAVSTTLPSGSFRALTYNVAGLPEGISQSHPATDQPIISPMLNTYDVVVVQEDFWYHDKLAKDAHHPYQSVPLSGYTTLVGDGLDQFSRFPYAGFTRVKWNAFYGIVGHANDGLASKGFSVGRFTLGPGVEIDIYNLHADAGDDPGDIFARSDQMKQLAAFMGTYSAGRPVIVGGDTNIKSNLPPDEANLQYLMKTCGLEDVARTLGKPEIIDRFFFRSTADVKIVPALYRLAAEFVDANGQPLSDHDALNVDFEWRRLK